MLNKNDLLKDVTDEKYIPMLKEVNIPDFTKCIAQFSGLHIKDVSDEVIKEYLLTWARNKYKFYKMLGNKLKVDNLIQYDTQELDVEAKINELRKEFPAYALWLEGFRRADKNKMSRRDISYSLERTVDELFPQCNIDGCTITHFFKRYLQAPDELVTSLGRIWENQKIEGTYTISIDPVDMMFASENPYNWTSCYRLELCNDGSHADGCVAAILDNSSLITYVWNREGKMSLYDTYDFKCIRYFRMRQWIAISPKETAIHFNKIYPGKSYSADFEKQLRKIVENLINKDAVWTRNESYQTNCHRSEPYGYGEYSYNYIYKIKDSEDEIWFVYNEPIKCPCGCGGYIPGSDDAEDDDGDIYDYNGDGFTAENFYFREPEGEWCDYLDDYCTDYENCEGCVYWNRCHPECELDVDHTCEYADEAEANGSFNPFHDNVVPCGGHCEGCPFHEDFYKAEKEKKGE